MGIGFRMRVSRLDRVARVALGVFSAGALSLAFVACGDDPKSSPVVTPQGGNNGVAGARDLDPDRVEDGQVTVLGTSTALGQKERTFSGPPSSTHVGDELVKCVYAPQGDYSTSGSYRRPNLLVTAGFAGEADWQAQVRLGDVYSETPISRQVSFDENAPGDNILVMARLTHDDPLSFYEYWTFYDPYVSPVAYSSCSVEVTQFDEHRLSGQVACKRLFASPFSRDKAAPGAPSPSASATLAFDCPLHLIDVNGRSIDGELSGVGGAPSMAGNGGAPNAGGAGAGGSGGTGGSAGTGGAPVVAPSLLTKLVPVSPTYDVREDQFSGASLDTTANSFASSGFVITAAVTNTAGYTVWGFKPPGSTKPYEVKLMQHAGASLDSVASSFAADGYVITAAVTNTAGYTVWGFKPEGSHFVYESRVSQHSGAALDSTITAFASDGFVITAAVANTAGYTVWGFRRQGETTAYEARLSQHSGAQLDSELASFASSGYIVTAATTNTAGYTIWGFRRAGSSTPLQAQLDQFSGAELTTTANTFASGGYLITAATTNTAGYTIWGFKLP